MSLESNNNLEEAKRLLQSGDAQNAVLRLLQVVQQDPSDGRAYGYLGIAQCQLGDNSSGIASLQTAAQLRPDDARTHYNLATALLRAQRHPEAQQALEQTLALEPGNLKALEALATLPAPTVAPTYLQETVPPPPAYPQTMGLSSPQIPGLHGEAQGKDMHHSVLGMTNPGRIQPRPLNEWSEPEASAPIPLTGAPPGYSPPQGLNAPPPQPGLASPNYTPPPGMGMPPPPPPQPGLASPNYAPPPGFTPGPGLPPLPPQVAGMQYQPQAPAFQPAALAPSLGLRIGRGIGWGALYGQWWTLGVFIWDILRSSGGEHPLSAAWMGGLTLLFALFFAFVGSVMGLIIGAMDAMPDTGAIVGVVIGLVMLGLEYLLTRSGMIFVNIFFWFFTGRFIGANIAARVQRPVQQ